jgi:hypothetical protein
MSGKKILKNSFLSLSIFVAGGVIGYSYNHFHNKEPKEIENQLLELSEFKQVKGMSTEDISKVMTIKTDSGEQFYALYKEGFFGKIEDIRYVFGDGYVLYLNNSMQYIEKPDLQKESVEASSNENIENKDIVLEEDISNDVAQETIPSKNISSENIVSELDKEKDNLEISSTENTENTENVNDISNIELSDLIIENYEDEQNIAVNTSSIDENSLNDSSKLNAGEIKKTEQKEERRVVEDLEFVDENVSGTTRDKVLNESIPDEEDRKKFEEEISSVAEKNYRRDAIMKISDRVSDFTINFESQTNEEKRVITVFTDPTCPYCQRLHGDIEKLQLTGYTIRYLLIPRDGMNSPVVPEITYASCFSKDRSKELVNQLFSGRNIDTSDMPEYCNSSIIERQLRLATSLGANSTPFIIDDQGGVAEGYSGIENMIKKLDASNASN